jgi:DNA helicase HerA-like ATPase
MTDVKPILLGRADGLSLELLPKLANRHGLIAGATGTGKTVTLQVMAEGFSAIGVPVFVADVKGDLAGLSQAGTAKPKIVERLATMGIDDHVYRAAPVLFWDLEGERGHPVRATISDMGPLLLSRLLDLSEAQAGVLSLAFRLADDEGLLLLDLKDLRAMLAYVADHASDLRKTYGQVSSTSVGAIQRALLDLDGQGGDRFFGEPALVLADLMLSAPDGRGAVNLLVADRLIRTPRLYATFLLWLLAELFENLPEIGDPEKPSMVFFFDEAHLLFDDAPKALVEKIEQVVRLIRSKGVGVYFVTQNPLDIPDSVSAQLGNRVQHALRAFTPKEQKTVRAVAETFRPNPKIDTARTVMELGVGEALISLLDPKGAPSVVERALVPPPSSRIGAVTEEEHRTVFDASPLGDIYNRTVDRKSAYEMLQARAGGSAVAIPKSKKDVAGAWNRPDGGSPGADRQPPATPAEPREVPRAREARRTRQPSHERGGGISDLVFGTGRRQGVAEAMAKSVARSIGSSIGRRLARGVLDSLLK